MGSFARASFGKQSLDEGLANRPYDSNCSLFGGKLVLGRFKDRQAAEINGKG
jgi:hypothetical protein